jgi:hypothetical protein
MAAIAASVRKVRDDAGESQVEFPDLVDSQRT